MPELQVSEAQHDAIRRRIDYKAPPHSPPGETFVIYEVFLDGEAKLLGMNKLYPSGVPAPDEAVRKATGEAVLSLRIRTRFIFGHDVSVSKPVAATKPGAARLGQRRPVPQPAPASPAESAAPPDDPAK